MFDSLKSGFSHIKVLSRLSLLLSTKEGKLKLLIGIVGFLLLGLALSIGALELTNTPQFCQSCHEMRPEYVTWKASSHSQLGCVDCHVEPGVGNLLQHKVKSFKQLYLHFSGKINPPIEVAQPIKDEVCERCHTAKRVATPSGDLIIPHEVHKENKVPCVKCHSAVAHANIGSAENGFTANGNWDKWIEPVGRAYMKADFLKFSMEECLNCHKQEDAGPKPNDCKACHNKLVKPETHNDPIFRTKHGLLAEQDTTQCNKCHRITISSKEPRVPVNAVVVSYARKNTFCADCHSNSKAPPASHIVSWKRTHALPATNDRIGCLVCHDEGKPTRGSSATKTYCYQCHETNIHFNVIVLGQHTKGTPVNGSVEPTQYPCLNCHAGSNCLRCHYIPLQSAQPANPQSRNPLKPGATLSPGSPGYSTSPGSGQAPNWQLPRRYNYPPPETG